MEGDFAQDCFYPHLLQNPLCHKLELIPVFAGPPVQRGALKSLESQACYIARPAMAMDALRQRPDGTPAMETPPDPRSSATLIVLDPLERILSVMTQPRIVDRILRHLRSERCQARDPFESPVPRASAVPFWIGARI
jgi:hypothetical protein